MIVGFECYEIRSKTGAVFSSKMYELIGFHKRTVGSSQLAVGKGLLLQIIAPSRQLHTANCRLNAIFAA